MPQKFFSIRLTILCYFTTQYVVRTHELDINEFESIRRLFGRETFTEVVEYVEIVRHVREEEFVNNSVKILPRGIETNFLSLFLLFFVSCTSN